MRRSNAFPFVVCLGLALLVSALASGTSGRQGARRPHANAPSRAISRTPLRPASSPGTKRAVKAGRRTPHAAAALPQATGSATRARSIELTFAGDVIFGRFRRAGYYDPLVLAPGLRAPRRGLPGRRVPSPDAAFVQVKHLLRSDLAVVNLETPLVRVLPQPDLDAAHSRRFGALPAQARALVAAGIDAVSLANNHAFDMSLEGIVQTPRILRELGVIPLGAGALPRAAPRVETVVRRGWRLGLVSITVRPAGRHANGSSRVPFALPWRLQRALTPLLRAARAQHDVLAVLVHWGSEYADEPDPQQRRVARRLIDAGADLVIGHHPHVLQGIERYGRGLIAYSLGNFLFENVHPLPRLSGVLRVRFSRQRGLAAATFHPAFIRERPRRPAPASGPMAARVRSRLAKLSRKLGRTRWRRMPGSEDLALVLHHRRGPALAAHTSTHTDPTAGAAPARHRTKEP